MNSPDERNPTFAQTSHSMWLVASSSWRNFLSGKRAKSGEPTGSIRCTASCQVRGLTQTPALVKGMKCNKTANKVSVALWRKKNEERIRPQRAGWAQETWADLSKCSPHN